MLKNSPVDIEGIYEDYISKKNEKNKLERYVGQEHYYHASSTGSCSRKIYFESIDKATPTDLPDNRANRLLRLGTVLHDDIQEPLLQYNVTSNGTLHSNKDTWSRKFGHKKDPNPSRLHEMQLGTYGIAVKEKFGRLDGMYLCYYKKDDSRLKSVAVPMAYLGYAESYWKDIKKEHEKGLPMFREGVSPAYPWMCGYCQFKTLCNPISFK